MTCFANNLFPEEYRLGNEWFAIDVTTHVARLCSVPKRFEKRFIDHFGKLLAILTNHA